MGGNSDGVMEEITGEDEELIESIKQDKARNKSAFTRIKNKLLHLLDEEHYSSRRKVKEVYQKLYDAQERAMETMELLPGKYLCLKEKDKRRKLGKEMDKMEMEFSEANEKANEYLESRKDELSSLVTDASQETRVRRIEERVPCKSVEKSKEDKFTIKEQSVRPKTDLEDLKLHQFRVDLFNDGKESDVKPQITGNPTTPTLGQDMWKQLR